MMPMVMVRARRLHIHLFVQCTHVQNMLCARYCVVLGCRKEQRPFLQIGEANMQSNNRIHCGASVL